MRRERYPYRHRPRREGIFNDKVYTGVVIGMLYLLSMGKDIRPKLPEQVRDVQDAINPVIIDVAEIATDYVGEENPIRLVSAKSMSDRERSLSSGLEQEQIKEERPIHCTNTIVEESGSGKAGYELDKGKLNELLCDGGVSGKNLTVRWFMQKSPPGSTGHTWQGVDRDSEEIEIDCSPSIMEKQRELSDVDTSDVDLCNSVIRHETGHVVDVLTPAGVLDVDDPYAYNKGIDGKYGPNTNGAAEDFAVEFDHAHASAYPDIIKKPQE